MSESTARSGTRLNIFRPAAQATYDRIFGVVYVGLMANVQFALATAPLLGALAVVRDPLASWPFFAVLSCLCAPALAGVFGCFTALDEDGSPVVLRPFWAAYRRAAGRVLAVWALGAGLVGVLVADAVALARTAWGPALVPLFLTLAVLVSATVISVITVLAAPRAAGDTRLRRLLWPCLVLTTRRWFLAVANVALLGLAATVVLLQPLVGLLVACAPLLYVVWANTRYAVSPLHDADQPEDSHV